ncbi:hypothetical protein [Pseudomonas sp. W03]|uniref:hypothetical protein n=1 Tax=Pseudomonas sp. W03 TaxID=3090666 RepID=UPI003A4D24DB
MRVNVQTQSLKADKAELTRLKDTAKFEYEIGYSGRDPVTNEIGYGAKEQFIFSGMEEAIFKTLELAAQGYTAIREVFPVGAGPYHTVYFMKPASNQEQDLKKVFADVDEQYKARIAENVATAAAAEELAIQREIDAEIARLQRAEDMQRREALRELATAKVRGAR